MIVGRIPVISPEVALRLVVIQYVPGTGCAEIVPITEVDPRDVALDIASGVWSYQRGPKPEEYRIGSAVRPPKEGECFGPVAVFDPEDPGHKIALMLACQDIGLGELAELSQ